MWCVTENKICKTLFLDCNCSSSKHCMWQSCRPSRYTLVCCELDNQHCQNFCHHYGWLLDSVLLLNVLFVVCCHHLAYCCIGAVLFLSLQADCCLLMLLFACQYFKPKLTLVPLQLLQHHHHHQLIAFEIIFYLPSVIAVTASTCCAAAFDCFILFLSCCLHYCTTQWRLTGNAAKMPPCQWQSSASTSGWFFKKFSVLLLMPLQVGFLST